MTTKKVDRRVQRTRQGLHQALIELIPEKRYDKITVQDIIDRANVGRSTFYSHFLDKEDLLIKGLQQYGDQFHADAAHLNDDSHVLHSLVFFSHAYSNRDFYRAMINGGGGDFMMKTGREHIASGIREHLGDKVEDALSLSVPLPVVVQYLAGAMMSVLEWWIEEEFPCPPEEVNAMYQALAMPSVQSLIAT